MPELSDRFIRMKGKISYILGTHLNHSFRSLLEISNSCIVGLKTTKCRIGFPVFAQQSVYGWINGKQQLNVIRVFGVVVYESHSQHLLRSLQFVQQKVISEVYPNEDGCHNILYLLPTQNWLYISQNYCTISVFAW